MAECTVKSPTNKHYTKIASLMAALSLWIALDKGSMGTMNEATNAPATEASETGLTRAAATVSSQTTTVTGDTMRATKTFTAGTTATITGFHVMSAASGGDDYGWGKFNSPQPLEQNDQLICTANFQYKKGT